MRSRAGIGLSMLCSIFGAGPHPSVVTIPGTSFRPPSRTASSSGAMAGSPSPRTTASTQPSAWRSTSPATKETLCPPKKTKQSGRARLIARERSIASGMLAR